MSCSSPVNRPMCSRHRQDRSTIVSATHAVDDRGMFGNDHIKPPGLRKGDVAVAVDLHLDLGNDRPDPRISAMSAINW